jgi:hypothetical protein
MGGMRFSLAELFWLTFWLAIVISLWRFIAFVEYITSLDEHVSHMFIASIIMVTVARLGAIKRRPKTGAAIGVLVALLAVTYYTLWVQSANPRAYWDH